MPARRSKNALPTVKLRVRVTGRHPRFFRKQVQKPERPIPAGSLVWVLDKNGRGIGSGFYNPRSQIALRMLHRGKRQVDRSYVLELLEGAIRYREETLGLGEHENAYRLVHAEGDGIPGLILDRLGQHMIAQVFALGIEASIEAIGEALLARYPGCKLVLRVDADARRLEGIQLDETGQLPAAELNEDGLRYRFTPGAGHKTGFFCDQRETRRRLGDFARGRNVLDLCCNSGGFAMHAARAGARQVLAVDLDEDAVKLARANLRKNSLRASVEHGDGFDLLRDRGKDFDLIVLDPPKWIHGEHDYESGLRRYSDFNRLAFEALEPGGMLLTCSCSGSLSEDRFLAMLRDAAARAGKDARVVEIRGAAPDHPVALECPETRYLKAAFVAVR